MARLFSITDGQLASTAGTVCSGTDAPPSGKIAVVLQNTGTSEETVILTFQVGGGTARRIARAVLQQDEQLVVSGIAIQPGDTLLGVTTTDSVVDYVVSASNAVFSIDVLSADGTNKGIGAIRKMVLGLQDLVGSELVDVG